MGGARRRGGAGRRQPATGPADRDGAEGDAEAACARTPPQPRGRQAQGLKPDEAEVVDAIQSLYGDQLKPFGRILRKRIAEHFVEREAARAAGGAAAAGATPPFRGYEQLPDVDVRHLKAVCDACGQVDVAPEEGGDWSAVLTAREQCFVDVYSPEDVYSSSMWSSAAAYFGSLEGEESLLPGGRYSCAQALAARGLSFLAQYSLGQVCHIVQLAISTKKILGYSNGAVVPYSRSQSMVKEQAAEGNQPCASSGADPPGGQAAQRLGLATWDVARSCLREILQGVAEPGAGPASLPLSNVKRLFRSKYQIELSETTLGHSRLSELLQDERFADVCTVELHGHGYMVVQADASAAADREPGEAPGEAPGRELLAQQGEPSTGPRRLFCPDEPLDFDEDAVLRGGAALQPVHVPATPLQSPGDPTPSTVSRWAPVHVPVTPLQSPGDPTPSTASRWRSSGYSHPSFSLDHQAAGYASAGLARAAVPPPSAAYLHLPAPPGAGRQRAHSLPRAPGADGAALEAAGPELSAEQALSAEAGPEPRSPKPDDAPMKILSSLSLDGEASWGEGAGAAAPPRVPFCPNEPLSLEDAGVFVPGLSSPGPLVAPPGLSPGEPGRSRWLALSPSWPEKASSSGVVKNTFIHHPPQLPTPAPGAARRARSLPKEAGLHRPPGWEAFDQPPAPVGSERSGAREGGGVLPSPGPALVPPSPALTASPGGYWPGLGRLPRTPVGSPTGQSGQQVLLLSDLL